jgi:hypothetical protein
MGPSPIPDYGHHQRNLQRVQTSEKTPANHPVYQRRIVEKCRENVDYD